MRHFATDSGGESIGLLRNPLKPALTNTSNINSTVGVERRLVFEHSHAPNPSHRTKIEVEDSKCRSSLHRSTVLYKVVG